MSARELSAAASNPAPADDLQDLLASVPAGLAIDINAMSEGYMVRVLGRGWNRGPAAIFSFSAVVLSVLFVIAAIKALRHEGFAAILITGCIAIAMWLVAIWRGRFVCEFEIAQPTLSVSTIAPLVGRLRRRAIAWREIERIAVEFLSMIHSKVQGQFVLEIARIDGSRDRYLRDYPVEGLNWLVAVLERFRVERETLSHRCAQIDADKSKIQFGHE